MNCYFRQKWRDPRLNFPEWVGTLSLSMKMLELLWRPDTVFHNSKHSYLHKIPTSNRLIRLYPNGTIWYSSRITVKARCNMNLKHFPVDVQTCDLVVGSFANSLTDMEFTWRLGNNKSVNFDTKVVLSQFDLIQYPQYDEIMKTNERVMTVLSMATLSFDIRSYIPVVSYFTALDWFLTMCYVFLLASLLQFAFVHYYTKFGYGEPIIRVQESFSSNECDLFDGRVTSTSFQRMSICYPRVARLQKSRIDEDDILSDDNMRKKKDIFLNRQTAFLFFLRLWKCLSGDTKYKKQLRKSANRFGINSISLLDIYARIIFPMCFLILNIIYWLYYLNVYRSSQ
ncbi:unnamed protein product [Didymodactylos carnosus]|uniref:Uncharacterized protein n=1 Tax=Didymodactylos carnosus TaxID=1234261 RepID=A0A815PFC3_9BILA|nr:unnamed protein product [Didymodactylos carnosus]CAF1448829.1 unnamed protein product [Didymodactylos carnosus]CAF3804935.1 unnamed protein product [Didymodactylos carnosus]CAF4322802.1 unnamed protein product [Didymodactylos carnosus]